MRIKKENAAALLVDIQERLFPHIFQNEELLKNALVLVKGLKILNIPIIATEQYVKGLGPTLEPLKQELEDIEYVEKMSFSCCGEMKVNEFLARTDKRTVIVFGVETHVCVLQTVLDLLANDYQPVIVEDCCSSRTPENKRIAIERMRDEGAIITSYESLLFELCRISGTDEFKAISKLVK